MSIIIIIDKTENTSSLDGRMPTTIKLVLEETVPVSSLLKWRVPLPEVLRYWRKSVPTYLEDT